MPRYSCVLSGESLHVLVRQAPSQFRVKFPREVIVEFREQFDVEE